MHTHVKQPANRSWFGSTTMPDACTQREHASEMTGSPNQDGYNRSVHFAIIIYITEGIMFPDYILPVIYILICVCLWMKTQYCEYKKTCELVRNLEQFFFPFSRFHSVYFVCFLFFVFLEWRYSFFPRATHPLSTCMKQQCAIHIVQKQ